MVEFRTDSRQLLPGYFAFEAIFLTMARTNFPIAVR